MTTARKWGIGLTVGAGLFAFLMWAVGQIRQYVDVGPASSGLESAVKAYKRAGLPFTAKEVYRHPVSEGNNAAPLLSEAFRLIGDLGRAHRAGREAGALIAEGKIEQAETKIAPFARPIDLALQASRLGACRFDKDLDLGIYERFPEMSSVLAITRLILARAEIQASKGQHREATDDLLAVVRLGSLVAEGPNALSTAAGSAYQNRAVRVSVLCALRAKRLEDAAVYIEWFDRLPEPISPIQGLRGEAYAGIVTIRNMRADELSSWVQLRKPRRGPNQPVVRNGLPPGPLSRAFMARHLEFWTDAWPVIVGFEQDPLKSIERSKSLMRELQSRRAVSDTLARMMMIDLTQAMKGALATVANRRVALTSIAVHAYRLRHGRLPDSLDEALPVVPVDPFDEKALRYAFKGGTFRVWSIGTDQVDDGGLTRREISKPGEPAERTQGDIIAPWPER